MFDVFDVLEVFDVSAGVLTGAVFKASVVVGEIDVLGVFDVLAVFDVPAGVLSEATVFTASVVVDEIDVLEVFDVSAGVLSGAVVTAFVVDDESVVVDEFEVFEVLELSEVFSVAASGRAPADAPRPPVSTAVIGSMVTFFTPFTKAEIAAAISVTGLVVGSSDDGCVSSPSSSAPRDKNPVARPGARSEMLLVFGSGCVPTGKGFGIPVRPEIMPPIKFGMP